MKEMVRALFPRPGLWLEAVRAAWALRPVSGRTLRGPFYRWRMTTAYGMPVEHPTGADLVDFLEWRKRQRA